MRIATLFLAAIIIPAATSCEAVAQNTSPLPASPSFDRRGDSKPNRKNRAVEAALELPRTEPEHYVRAITTLIDLGAAEQAKPILDELGALSLPQSDLAKIVRQLGSRSMLLISQEPALQPAGRKFADAAMDAAASLARHPGTLDEFIAKLGSEEPQQQRLAIVRLQEGGNEAVVRMIAALRNDPPVRKRAGLQSALLSMGQAATPLLVPLLDSNEPDLVADAVSILTSGNNRQFAPLLIAPALLETGAAQSLAARGYQRLAGTSPTDSDALRSLQSAIELSLAGTPPFQPDAENRVTLWWWNREKKELESHDYTEREAATIWAAQLSRDLARASAALSLRPGRVDPHVLALGLSSEATMLQFGYASVADDRVLSPHTETLFAQSSPNQWSLAIAYCLEHRLWGGAALAAEQLGTLGDLSALTLASPQVAPLVRALRAPHPHTRFAAISACMQLGTNIAFPGKSYLKKGLVQCAESDRPSLALVAMPTLNKATAVAGMVRGIQLAPEDTPLRAEGFNNGRDLLTRATKSSHCSLILVDFQVLRPGIREVLYQLRSSTRCGATPIAILTPPDQLLAAERIAETHQHVLAFPRPDSQGSIERIVKMMSQSNARYHLPHNLRKQQAEHAREWLAETYP